MPPKVCTQILAQQLCDRTAKFATRHLGTITTPQALCCTALDVIVYYSTCAAALSCSHGAHRLYTHPIALLSPASITGLMSNTSLALPIFLTWEDNALTKTTRGSLIFFRFERVTSLSFVTHLGFVARLEGAIQIPSVLLGRSCN